MVSRFKRYSIFHWSYLCINPNKGAFESTYMRDLEFLFSCQRHLAAKPLNSANKLMVTLYRMHQDRLTKTQWKFLLVNLFLTYRSLIPNLDILTTRLL